MPTASRACRLVWCTGSVSELIICRSATRCACRHSQCPMLSSAKESGSSMLIVSRLPSSEACWLEPTASEGMMMSGGRLPAVWKWRVSQPAPVLPTPGRAQLHEGLGVEVAARRVVEAAGVHDGQLAGAVVVVQRGRAWRPRASWRRDAGPGTRSAAAPRPCRSRGSSAAGGPLRSSRGPPPPGAWPGSGRRCPRAGTRRPRARR